jgi:hypothetical protein
MDYVFCFYDWNWGEETCRMAVGIVAGTGGREDVMVAVEARGFGDFRL